MHGGTNTGAPEGNQNARTHGGYSIVLGALTDDEREAWGDLPTDPAESIDNALRLLTLQEARVLRTDDPRVTWEAKQQALSRILARKARYIEAKLKAQGDREEDLGDIDQFMQGLGSDEDTYQPGP
jgi:uncharacterized protein YjcR